MVFERRPRSGWRFRPIAATVRAGPGGSALSIVG
eukprot:gene48752-3629_t